MRPHRSCRAALALLALLLGACGSDEPRSAGSAAAVRGDVTRALTKADPSICETRGYATQRFAEQASVSIPELDRATEKICRADVATFAADAVKLTRVKIDGDRATARMTADGGAYGYGALDLALVRDGSWKLDLITAVDLDRARFEKLQERFARVGDEPASPVVTACVSRRLARLSDAQIERAVVRADPAFVSNPLLVCVVRPQLRMALSIALTSCVMKQLGRDPAELLGTLLGDDEEAINRLFARAAGGCAGTPDASAA